MKQRLRTDCTIDTDDYIITYDCIDESFDHEFGTEKSYGYDIIDIKVYIPVIQDYVDYELLPRVSMMDKIYSIAQKAVDRDLENNGYFEEVEPNNFDQDIQ